MASSIAYMQSVFSPKPINETIPSLSSGGKLLGKKLSSQCTKTQKSGERKPLTVVAAFGDVSPEGTTYLIAGAAAVALLGTAFPILFSRKDL